MRGKEAWASGNSPGVLTKWAVNVLLESDVGDDYDELLKVAKEVIAKGGWRGDICARWRSLGYGPDKIEGFYP